MALEPVKPQEFPLISQPTNRDQTTSKDARIVNCFIEKDVLGEMYIYKRPGLSVNSTVVAATNGYGCYNWKGDIYSIFGSTLYKNGVAITGPALDTSNGVYTWDQLLGATPKLFFTNGIKAYTYDPTGGLVLLTDAFSATVTGNITSGSAVVTSISPNTTGFTAGMVVTGTGIPTGAKILSVDSTTQITLTVNATSTTTGVSLTVANTGFPTGRVKGSAYLDGTLYVTTQMAYVRGSNINDLTVFDPLNSILAQTEPDMAMATSKQLVYVIVFKEWSTESFYDAGNATGSPLGPVQGQKVNLGCVTADSVRELEGTLFWVAKARSGSLSVYLMDGLKAQLISTPAVDRLIQEADFTSTYSWTAKINGHKLYVLTLVNSNLTLVYDLTMNTWYQWTDSNGNYLPIISSTYTSNQRVLLQHATNGNLYTFEDMVYQDDTGFFPVDIYTPNYDGKTRVRKMMTALDINASQNTGSILYIRKSDDDYQTWSNFRSVDLGKKRPRLNNMGTFRRRAFHLHTQDGAPFRIQSMEMWLEIGAT